MSSIFTDGALHPGRDANDAWWVVVRRAEDWGTAMTGAHFDPSRDVVELAPAALAPGDGGPATITGPDGTIYRADPIAGVVTRQGPCETAAVPIAWGLRDPSALALDDRGWLYVADRGNHRVIVIDPADRRIVIVLPAPDPVSIAIGRTRIFVANADGRIDVFARTFGFDRSFTVTGTPIAIGADGDTVVIADAGSSDLARYSCTGAPLGQVAWDDAPAELAGLASLARCALEGTVVVGPIDGGVDRLAWHEIVVDAELPPGTRIEVQTFAVDPQPSVPPAPPPGPPLLAVAVPWAPATPIAMPVAGLESARGELVRPVLSDTAAWERWREAPYRRGADVYAFAGDGPNAAASFVLPPEVARVLRAGDEVELSAAATVEPATVQTIAPRTVTLAAAGKRQLYGANAIVTLVERGGRVLDPTPIDMLGTGDTIDVSSISADDVVGDVIVPHARAALLYPGDVVDLSDGTNTVRLWIDALDPGPLAVALTAPTTGNFANGTLRLVTPLGRLVVDHATGWGDGFPPGDTISVDFDSAGLIKSTTLTVAWSDPATATIFTTTSAPTTWLDVNPGAPAAATDRGRYLWIKLRLIGALANPTDETATATPVVHGLRAVAPRLSYLTYLPAVYSRRDDDDPSGAIFLERYLAMFEGRLTDAEGRYESVARQLNPLAADDEWLAFVGSWFALIFDPSWPRARKALLLTEIFDLYRRRGTAGALARLVEIYTGHAPEIIEGFQQRPRGGLVLGGGAAALGCAPLGGLDTCAATSTDLLGAYAHRFTMVAYADGDCDLAVVTTALRAIVDAAKPLHTQVDLRVVVPGSRIEFETTVGLDFILGDGASTRHPHSPLGGTSVVASRPAPILGVDATLGGDTRSGPRVGDGVGPTIGNFDLQ
jgi:phage tail-like protein